MFPKCRRNVFKALRLKTVGNPSQERVCLALDSLPHHSREIKRKLRFQSDRLFFLSLNTHLAYEIAVRVFLFVLLRQVSFHSETSSEFDYVTISVSLHCDSVP